MTHTSDALQVVLLGVATFVISLWALIESVRSIHGAASHFWAVVAQAQTQVWLQAQPGVVLRAHCYMAEPSDMLWPRNSAGSSLLPHCSLGIAGHREHASPSSRLSLFSKKSFQF